MALRRGNRKQTTLFPDTIEGYISENDPVRAYDAFVDALDLKKLGIEVNESEVGNSSYHPLIMLKILIYGYSYGWRSSRKIERALHHNMSFIWIAEGLKPNNKTIAEFRRKNKKALKNVLVQCARICLKLNLIEGNTLFTDGSKLRANAGNRQTKSPESWRKYRDQTIKQIDKLLEECNRIDKLETENLVKLNKELKSKENLKTKIDNLLEEFSKEDRVNGTDPEAKIMSGRQGVHVSYNNQVTTDEAHGLIVSAEATNSGNDLNELTNQIKIAEETLGEKCKIVCADAGYSSVDDLVELVKEKTVVVPSTKQAQKEIKDEPFGKQNFTYDSENDEYTCPEGKCLRFATQRTDSNRKEYRMKNKQDCISCKHYGQCTKSKDGRTVGRLINEETKELLEQIYDSKSGQKIYEKRKMKVELQFGHIKRNLGVSAFLLRGLKGVNAELGIFSACFNMARMITIIGGVPNLIEKLAIR